jgi:hypothetical protein
MHKFAIFAKGDTSDSQPLSMAPDLPNNDQGHSSAFTISGHPIPSISCVNSQVHKQLKAQYDELESCHQELEANHSTLHAHFNKLKVANKALVREAEN